VKKLKWLGVTGAAVALGTAGLLVAPSTQAGGVTPPIVAGGPGSHVTCQITGSTTLTPALADDWLASEHSADPSSVATFRDSIASIATHTFSAGAVPVATGGKSVAASCTNTHVVDVTDHSRTAEIASASISTSGTSTGADEATCDNLANPPNPDGPKEVLTSVIKWTATDTTKKIAPTTVHAELSAYNDVGTDDGKTNTGAGFHLDSNSSLPDTSIEGSFAGGTSQSVAYIDATTVQALAVDSFHLRQGVDSAGNALIASVCQPTVQVKATPASDLVGDSVSIKVKKPKGLKKIIIGSSGAQNASPLIQAAGGVNDTPSTLDFIP